LALFQYKADCIFPEDFFMIVLCKRYCLCSVDTCSVRPN